MASGKRRVQGEDAIGGGPPLRRKAIPQIQPRLGILMNEKRTAPDVFGVAYTGDRKPPRVPSVGRNRMRRRADAERVQDEQLAIRIPAILQKPFLRRPTMGKGRGAS